MTPERFRELIEVYGVDPRRWPATERTEALAYRQNHADDVQTALAEASELDDMMERFAVTPPGAALCERIVASGPTPGSDGWRAALWWQSAGAAGVGLAGAVVGALMISTVASVDLPADDEDVGVATAFEDFSFPSEP